MARVTDFASNLLKICNSESGTRTVLKPLGSVIWWTKCQAWVEWKSTSYFRTGIDDAQEKLLDGNMPLPALGRVKRIVERLPPSDDFGLSTVAKSRTRKWN